MRACRRGGIPTVLVDHGETWSRAYVHRREANPSAEFAWPQHEGLKLNHILLPFLGAMTEAHCAYCDGFPLNATSDPTIDHFKPKSRFPDLVCCWENLFFACRHCQQVKAENFDPDILRPDDDDLAFDRYFLYQEKTGEIVPNPAASDQDRRRAELTIEMLGLNAKGRPRDRTRSLMRYRNQLEASPLNEWPYRFLLDS